MEQAMANKPPTKTRVKLMNKEASMVLILLEQNKPLKLDLISDHNPFNY
jgi:hypothetical protein